MKFLIRIGILLLLGALSIAGAQTLYKSVGPDGKTIYSDRPPADGRIEKTLKFENLPTSALPAASSSYVEQLRRMQAASARPSAATGLILYSAVWCGYCKLAKAYLESKGVSYQEVDIDTKTGIAALVQAGGGKGVPLLVAGEQRVQGFSAPAYDAFFAGRK